MPLTISPRTVVRNTIVAVLENRKGNANVRVQTYAISKKYLNAQEATQDNTYCVIVTDELREPSTFQNENWKMMLKIVCYANDPTDPHAIIDAMVEDLIETMSLVNGRTELAGIAWKMTPVSISSDERTTDAGPWGQAVCEWTMDHERRR